MRQTSSQTSSKHRVAKPAKRTKKLASYAVAATGAAVGLGGASLAEAGIITGQFSPAVVANPFPFGGSVNFQIPGGPGLSNPDNPLGTVQLLNLYQATFSNPAGNTFQFMLVPSGPGAGFGAIVGADYSINSERSFSGVAGFTYFAGNNYGSPPYIMPAREGFVGFKVNNTQTGGKDWYGWLAVKITGSNKSYTTTISAYGYDTTGASILAGQTAAIPEPTGLAMVALGGLAMASRRWRRIGQKTAA